MPSPNITRHLTRSAVLILLAAAITSFVSTQLPKRSIKPALRYYAESDTLKPFERYLSQFPRKELPVSFDIRNFEAAHDYYKKLKDLKITGYVATKDSLCAIANRYMYIPDHPRTLNVTGGHMNPADSQPGDYFLKMTLSDNASSLQREEGIMIPVMAFETSDYYGTVTFTGHSPVYSYEVYIYGNYQLDYFSKDGRPLGRLMIAAVDDLPFAISGSIGSDGRYSRTSYKLSKSPDKYSFEPFTITPETRLPWHFRAWEWGVEYHSEFIKSMQKPVE